MRVLVSEPDGRLAAQLRAVFAAETLVIDASGLADTVHYATAYAHDAIVLSDADRLVRELRKRGITAPIVVERRGEGHVWVTDQLRDGADAIVPHHCTGDHLHAQIVALVRRGRGQPRAVLQWGPLELDLNAAIARVRGKPLHVTAKEFILLETLLLRVGQCVHKEALMQALYSGRDEPEIKIVDVLVCKLRKKLVAVGIGRMIETNWARGYSVSPPAPAGSA